MKDKSIKQAIKREKRERQIAQDLQGLREIPGVPDEVKNGLTELFESHFREVNKGGTED